jgi:hypothetical protein
VAPAGVQVLKFSPAGKLLLRIGTPGVYGNDETHLSQPSDVVTSPVTGEVFVADGHDSPQGRIFSGHRGEGRIDIFDQNGKLLAMWKQFGRGTGVFIDKNDILYTADSGSSVNQGNAFDGRIYISGVTPPGLGRYTINTNTKPAPQQGAGRGGAAQSDGQ